MPPKLHTQRTRKCKTSCINLCSEWRNGQLCGGAASHAQQPRQWSESRRDLNVRLQNPSLNLKQQREILQANGEMGSWVVEMQYRLNAARIDWSQEDQSGRTIYKVPPLISNVNKKAYQPRVVSFGPYHHGEPHLKSMEAHKERALLCCIHRSGLLVQEVFAFVAEVAQELKDSYDSLDSAWQHDTDKFVQLMMLDGCFMLELVRVAYQSENYYFGNDPVFSRHGDLYLVPFIKADMLLLENQLPMLLLIKLKCILENIEPDIEDLNADILWLLDHDISKYSDIGKCLHVLDLHRKGLLHGNAAPQSPDQSPDQREGKNNRVGHNVVRPATELHEAGVRFMKSKSTSLLDITFDGGILKLPNFMVDDDAESMFLNLIAFERCHIPAGSDITSFVAFMDNIIDDDRDIKLLSSKGIIDNNIGTDKEAADLFNTMSKDLAMEMNNNLGQVYKNLITYCNTPWHKWRANLTQIYFRNPWAIISVIAAFILFSLATVQTIFTILN
ncbi:UPF0481 protein At3g47200-like [Diospyros lotus]|uniref:UPF0481 protein At3g47200-like n=1 Tax=Diospyros lotus TaxID=55363 RepID=UPI002256842F|nr:UPF0481 protein At3g47200-like [Diospyros lotus]